MDEFSVKALELKVFTMPTCSSCPTAKQIALEVAKKLGLSYREVDMNTNEGLAEGLTLQIMGTPSIALGDEVIVAGRLITKERLEEEVRRRLERWRARASSDTPKEG
ncbi:MAG: thioredoxin family protein [Candidatus Bathyarchaeia archaeon]